MTPAEPRVLPMFPPGTVLFPGGLLPPHIFEPRYRALTRACLELLEALLEEKVGLLAHLVGER